ncbi:hypothetical protein H253_5703, partial [Klebsiella pneumoniae KP-7]
MPCFFALLMPSPFPAPLLSATARRRGGMNLP